MISLLGPAGSGKSLQGQLIAERYGWKWLSIGQLLRDQHDVAIDEKLTTGELFDDEFVTGLMHNAMKDAEKEGKGVILDGYPRDEVQAKWMVEQGDAKKIDGVIVFEVTEDELWKRIEERQRTDDTKEVVKRRWEIFEQNICSILPLLERENVKITTVDGVGSVEDVTARLEAILEEWGAIDDAARLHSEIERDDEGERSYGE